MDRADLVCLIDIGIDGVLKQDPLCGSCASYIVFKCNCFICGVPVGDLRCGSDIFAIVPDAFVENVVFRDALFIIYLPPAGNDSDGSNMCRYYSWNPLLDC